MKEITLQVNGREMTFSEQELINILEEHFPNSTTAKVAKKPTEGEWFEVKPQAIDQKLFENAREDENQEKTRRIIIEAFEEMSKYPEKYARNFKTLRPKKEWYSKTVYGLKKIARRLGDHNADWVEQALEWGQRLSNGESWEELCNTPDNNNYLRVVSIEGADSYMIIGGTKKHHYPEGHKYFDFGYRMPSSTLYCAKANGVPTDCVPLLFKAL